MQVIPMQIVFKDRDGNLIMNRKSDASWFERDQQFLKNSLELDARTKGVRIISSNYSYVGTLLMIPKAGGSIECLVEYLGGESKRLASMLRNTNDAALREKKMKDRRKALYAAKNSS